MQRVYVNVPNQELPTYLYLYGHAFPYQMYCIYDMKPEPFMKVWTNSVFVDGLSSNRVKEAQGDRSGPMDMSAVGESPRLVRKLLDLNMCFWPAW